ncbi:MAG TPA: GTPase [Streptosporangiaceae bacterium]|nr:GTPase [Streptosporangiaceae bacterium]
MTSASSLSGTARQLLQRAIEAYRDSPETQRWLRGELERIDAPLQVAIAGKVKAGKSTLLNAMVGEMVAATDAAECTKLVTWYQYASSPRLTLYPKQGAPRPLPASRRDGRLLIDLDGTPAEDVDRLVVDWPSRRLQATTLIDTPGIGSMTTENSERSAAFLLPEDEPAAADAVVYLMRHLHATDFEFLEAFSEYGAARASGLNAIAVLSRADEIGGGRLDALQSARRVASRYRADPRLLGLCQDVVSVAGLLAQAGRSLRQDEFQAFTALAAATRDDTDALLLSVDRFLVSGPREDALLPIDTRRALLDRFGLFGVRLATTLVRQGSNGPDLLAAELVRRSGLDDLRTALASQFTQRRDLLKARSALLAVDHVLRREPSPQGRSLLAEVERILAGSHEFVEMRLLAAIRSSSVTIPDPYRAEAERLLGANGTSPAQRLGLVDDTDPRMLRAVTVETLERWRRLSEHPVYPRAFKDAARTVVRSCEGILFELPD